MRRLCVVLAAAVAAACGDPAAVPEAEPAAAVDPDAASEPPEDFPDSTSTLVQTVGPYEVRVVGPIWPGHSRIVVERDGRRVWSRLGHFVGTGQGGDVGTYSSFAGPDAPPADTSAVRDLNGDGTPELLAWWTTLGGGMCCTIVGAVSLAPDTARTVFELNVGRSEVSGFRDLDGDGVDEFLHLDGAFAYWNTCGACSPYPDVVLAWDGARWEFSERAMRRPLPPADTLAARAVEVREATAEGAGYPPYPLWETMIDLIYAGHWDAADRFLVRAWPASKLGDDAPSREAFAAEFAEQLRRSPFYDALLALNDRQR